MAALTLADNGYDVTVYDARPSDELASDGILGITDSNWGFMQELYGVNFDDVELKQNTYTDIFGFTTVSPFHYIVWTDLHNALTDRAVKAGVEFRYGHKAESGEFPESDVVIWATGVGSAKDVSTPHYTGYTVVRGLAYQFSGTPWQIFEGMGQFGRWVFTVGDTRDGASVTMFLPRTSPQMRTTYSAVAPAEIRNLPTRYQRLLESVPMWQTAPLSDWDVPAQLSFRTGDGQHVIRLGDANGQMRPQTSMGANLALDEAMNLPALLDPITGHAEAVDRNLIRHRAQQHRIGIAGGI
jgi:2-polyprenyl-6-methoxyphenol hydroxylase-like FAD-dependent oxidoreductase